MLGFGKGWWRLLRAAALMCLALTACDQNIRDETTTFEQAERLYRAGDYDGAANLYRAFLREYPRSPFTRTAELRLKTIEREVDAVMNTRGGNRPIYIRPNLGNEEGPTPTPSPEGPVGPFSPRPGSGLSQP